MKQLIKKIVPKPVLNTALDIRDKRGLRVVPRQNFDATHLKRACELDLSAIFSDEKIEKIWRSSHEDISALFGDGATFGGVNPGDRRALFYLITALKPQRVLEIGTHIGASTLYIAKALQNISSDTIVTTVDILDVNHDQAPWQKLGLDMCPRDYADKLGCLAHIEFRSSPAQSFMKDAKDKSDFIFLDGDHSAQAVYKEVSAALSLLRAGGVILLHDYYPEARPLFANGNVIAGPFRALDRIKRENRDICVRPLGELPWPTKLGSRLTSLAVLTKH